jgi:hypothetical protein
MLTDLPIFMDGSDGSLWPLDPETEWPRVLSGAVDRDHRYLRVSDVIALLNQYESKKHTEHS